MATRRIIIASLGFLASLAGAGAEESDQALVFTVHPSAPQSGPVGETLDEKLARRERGLRFICLGCVRADGRVDTAPFYPVRTLNAPQLTAAFAAEARSRDGNGVAEPRQAPGPAALPAAAPAPPLPVDTDLRDPGR